MCYFNVLSQTMSTMFVRGISEVAEVLVAIKRIQEFLMNEEFVEVKHSFNNNEAMDKQIPLSLRSVSAKWNPSSSDNTLSDIEIKVPKGNLVGIIGPVGSGKSSLLQAILGKIKRCFIFLCLPRGW